MSSEKRFNNLKKLNPDLSLMTINDSEFSKYGRVLKNDKFKEISEYLKEKTEIPEAGNVYQADLEYFAGTELKKDIEKDYYGEMPVEIGYCNGNNSSLNGLEYHNGAEINIAVTDLILLLGEKKDIREDGYDSKKVEAFYLEQGSVIELYGTSLHFAPCKVEKKGFKCAVILPDKTNLDLETSGHDDSYLFARNKWLLVHPEKEDLIKKGAKAAIKGENLKVKI